MQTHTSDGREIQYGEQGRFKKFDEDGVELKGTCLWCDGTGMFATIAYNGLLNTGYVPCKMCGGSGNAER